MFIYKVKNAIFIKKSRSIIENAYNNIFVIYILYKKIVVSI